MALRVYLETFVVVSQARAPRTHLAECRQANVSFLYTRQDEAQNHANHKNTPDARFAATRRAIPLPGDRTRNLSSPQENQRWALTEQSSQSWRSSRCRPP